LIALHETTSWNGGVVLGETNEIRKKDYSQVSRRALHENYL